MPRTKSARSSGRRLSLLIVLCFAAVSGPLVADDADSEAAVDPQQMKFFEKRIRPLLADNCYECHASDTQESNLRVDSRGALIQGGDIGAAIVPGKPDESLLIDAVQHGDVVQMPPERKLSARQIDNLTKWVEMGAPWPGETSTGPPGESTAEGYRFTDEDREFWSFVPVRDSQPPDVENDQWPTNGVDRFLLAALSRQNLQPAPEADRYTLLRRVTYDLTGLPPTPDEIRAFINDPSPNAFETVVNRLLDSPRYGEKWGRHWLDVVRFAEGAGHCSDWVYRLGWRYRDYVIEAFNNDMPYDQFIVEQLAGDLLASSGDVDVDLQRLIATGFLHVGHRPLAERDKTQMMLEVVDEQHNTTGVAFMGLAIGCLAYGATDEFGYFAVENVCTIYDLHATILHLLGLDHERLTYRYAGRDFRLTDVHGRVVHDIMLRKFQNPLRMVYRQPRRTKPSNSSG